MQPEAWAGGNPGKPCPGAQGCPVPCTSTAAARACPQHSGRERLGPGRGAAPAPNQHPAFSFHSCRRNPAAAAEAGAGPGQLPGPAGHGLWVVAQIPEGTAWECHGPRLDRALLFCAVGKHGGCTLECQVTRGHHFPEDGGQVLPLSHWSATTLSRPPG